MQALEQQPLLKVEQARIQLKLEVELDLCQEKEDQGTLLEQVGTGVQPLKDSRVKEEGPLSSSKVLSLQE